LIERTGEAFEEGIQLTVVGPKLTAGDLAPELGLENFDPSTNAMTEVALANSAGSVRLLNVINSVDTPVCDIETKRWETLRKGLPGVQFFTVSMDLPFAMARWQTAGDVTHAMLSAHKNEKFAIDYGVLLKEWRLLQRAVFVIDKGGKIVYSEYVDDQMKEPDYDAAIRAASSVS